MISSVGPTKWRYRVVVFVLAVMVPCLSPVIHHTVWAQIIDCSESVSGGGTYQVYLDELSFARTVLETDPELERLMSRLSFKLGSKVEALTLNTIPVPLAFAFCDNRRPGNSTQFTESLIDDLDDEDVILELWGQLNAEENDGTIIDRKATIRFVLVPVLADGYEQLRTAGFQSVDYPKQTAGSDELIDLLEQSLEMEAFVAVGVGVNLLKNGQYDDALRYLCKAIVILEGGSVGIEDAPREALITYVKSKASESVQGPLADLVDSDNPCPCGR